MMHRRKIIDLEQGWGIIQNGITKLKNRDERLPETRMSAEDYMTVYTAVYDLCMARAPHCFPQQLYDRCQGSLKEYISTVLPSLRQKHGEARQRELIKSWEKLKAINRLISYIDRYYDKPNRIMPLDKVAVIFFRDLVFTEIKDDVRDEVISQIHQERQGEQIDQASLKKVLDIFVEMGHAKTDYYESYFEAAMLEDSAAYYSRKASCWILEDSFPNYMLKVEECLNQEKDRVANYLHPSSEPKLLERVQHELLLVHLNQLLENEHSGCQALLRDDKVEDLSRMYRLFSKIPRGLDLILSIFEQHVSAEGTALVKLSNDAANEDYVFVRLEDYSKKVIELHDKYLRHVKKCFQNQLNFHRALRSAFEGFCSEGVAGVSREELLATFCDSIYNKSGS